MGVFTKLFQRKKPERREAPPLPTWEEVVEIMYDRDLYFRGPVEKVQYSPDRTMRFVIWQDSNGYYRFTCEKLYAYDADDWQYVGRDPNALPGYWLGPAEWDRCAFCADAEIALREMRATPEYKACFPDE